MSNEKGTAEVSDVHRESIRRAIANLNEAFIWSDTNGILTIEDLIYAKLALDKAVKRLRQIHNESLNEEK